MQTKDSRRDAKGNALPHHPACAIFPRMDKDARAALAADIKTRGLIDPIMLDHEGEQLIDGRERLDACIETGVEPQFDRLSENDDPVDYIIGKNRHRRHLTPAQIALAALRLSNMGHGGDRRSEESEQRFSKSQNDSLILASPYSDGPVITQAEAARHFGIDVAQVKRMAAFQDKAPKDVFAGVDDGRIKTPGKAYDLVTLNKQDVQDGVTIEQKQRAWLKDPWNRPRREPKANDGGKPAFAPSLRYAKKIVGGLPADLRDKLVLDMAVSPAVVAVLAKRLLNDDDLLGLIEQLDHERRKRGLDARPHDAKNA
jgi:hypothetical protein